MDDNPSIGVENLTAELVDFYRLHGLDRAEHGREGLEWSFDGTEQPFCVMRSNDEIVGLSAYIRSRFKLGSEIGSAFQDRKSVV